MAKNVNPDVLKRLARLGAQARLDQIEAERLAILGTFPDLAAKPRAARRVKAAGGATPAGRRRKMTRAQRKAVSERMKKFWAERKKTQAEA